MTKTLISILIALVLVLGAAGIAVAAAQQSQPSEPLYELRTWSTQMFHQHDKTHVWEQAILTQYRVHEREKSRSQILEQLEHTTQTQSSLHQAEISPIPRSPIPPDVNDHAHQDDKHDGTNHENNGSEHGKNDH